jgi:RimJ/RimL family protein N-acetyltransferase
VPILAPDPPLSDDRVTLRPWQEGDAAAIVPVLNEPAIALFLDRVPQPYTVDDARWYIDWTAQGWRDGSGAAFAVCLAGTDEPVGSMGIRWDDLNEGVAEVGYWVAATVRGRGVATAALRLIARWAFTAAPELARLQLRADVTNAASNRVAEKAGFTREGVLRSQRFNARLGRRVDFAIWSLLRAEV